MRLKKSGEAASYSLLFLMLNFMEILTDEVLVERESLRCMRNISPFHCAANIFYLSAVFIYRLEK